MSECSTPRGWNMQLMSRFGSWSETFREAGFLRTAIVLGGSTALSHVILALSGPLLTRLYSPADMGVQGVFTSLVAIPTIVASLRYELAVPALKEDRDAANLLAVCLMLILLSAVGSWWVMYFFGEPIAAWFNAPQLNDYAWLIPLALIGGAGYQAFTYWMVRTGEIGLLGRTRLTQCISQVVAQVGLGLFVRGPLGLLLGDVVGRTAGTSKLAQRCWRSSTDVFRQVSWSGMRSIAHRHRRYPLMTAPSAVLDMSCARVPSLVLAAVHGVAVAGGFELVTRLLGLPVMLIGRSVGTALLSAAGRTETGALRRLRTLFRRLTVTMAAIAIICSVVFILPSPWLFGWIFGPDWRDAGWYAVVMIPRFMAEFVASPVNFALPAIERQDLQLWQTTVYVAAMAVATLLIVFVPMTPLQSVMVYSAAGTAGYGARLLMGWLAFRWPSAAAAS